MALNIRLLIVEYFNRQNWAEYCWYHNARFDILRKIQDDTIDLIVTPHNFLCFQVNCLFSSQEYISFLESKVAKQLQTYCKNSIILGIDFVGANINPYSSNKASVIFFKKNNQQLKYKSHIWEVWTAPGRCNAQGFIEQNKKRIITINKLGRQYKIGLLSCGDIAYECISSNRIKLDYLPAVDIYINLSHKSLTGRTPQYNMNEQMFLEKKCWLNILTHQVSLQTLKKYYKEQAYPFVDYLSNYNIACHISPINDIYLANINKKYHYLIIDVQINC